MKKKKKVVGKEKQTWFKTGIIFFKKPFFETHPYVHAHALGQMPILGGSYHAIITAYHSVLKHQSAPPSTIELHLNFSSALEFSLYSPESSTKGSINICESK